LERGGRELTNFGKKSLICQDALSVASERDHGWGKALWKRGTK